jgi:thiamine-phosphate pyrophosphorylase
MIVLSNPIATENEIDTIHQLFELGLELFHIRKPNYSESEMKNFIGEIKMEFRTRLVLHNHHRLAKKFGINRIHFTEKARNEIYNPITKLTKPPKNPFQKMVKRGFHLSTSVHEILSFNHLETVFEYAFLSPVFPSISKEDYYPLEDLFIEIKKRTNPNTRLIALGGISSKNGKLALTNGFDDLALLGAIWNSNNPIENFTICQQIAQ